MLDAATKSRIDSARDILVGKVPDPKSQVEQITIALIYKFMDDMDRQSEELGGKATFFTGEFKKYRWAQLLDKRYSGHERLLLYAEGIETMNVNKNIPQLFRDIFKGVFLPYRDPETLNLFLKEIDGFSYDHSERLGDAFEYLLSVLGTQGDAGQFRTPRHIIDFIVAVVDPKKTESVLDPACGTAGFLISAYKHILAASRPGAGGTAPSKAHNGGPGSTPAESAVLTPDERARLMTNFRGYDIAPDMVRLSRANLYLHGFPNPVVHEYDTLTSEERWDERYDVILANPPFMTPKGGVRPHNRFSIQAKRSEVLFVDYIAEHLNPRGRAGIIVPEGIIFQSQNAYKQLRRMLVENYLWAVVSLPSGVFNPYAGVKTSILFLDRNLARQRDEVLFVKIENDGFDLGAQRRPIEKNDLPGALTALRAFVEGRVPPRTDGGKTAGVETGPPVIRVLRSRLLESPDVNLSGDRYRVAAIRHTGKWPMVKLGEVCRQERQIVQSNSDQSAQFQYLGLENVESETGRIVVSSLPSGADGKSTTFAFDNRHVLYGKLRPYLNKVALPNSAGRCTTELIPLLPGERLNREFLAYILRSRIIVARAMDGKTGSRMPRADMDDLLATDIPLPPLDEQERIVAELEGYRKVIEGARQILSAYKPAIRIDPDWPEQPLGQFAKILNGGTPAKAKQEYWEGSVPWVSPKDMKLARIADTADHISEKAVADSAVNLVHEGAILCVVRSGILAHRFPVALALNDLAFNQDINAIVVNEQHCIPEWMFHVLRSSETDILARGTKRGGTVHSLQNEFLRELPIPLPPLAIQREIVAELEAERKLVEANRELIARMEAKIKAKLAEVWGG